MSHRPFLEASFSSKAGHAQLSQATGLIEIGKCSASADTGVLMPLVSWLEGEWASAWLSPHVFRTGI